MGSASHCHVRALARHDAILQEAVLHCSGRVVKHTGDGIIAVFTNGRAIECVVQAQKAVNAADWSAVEGLHVRMCVFTGEAEERDGDFFGPALNGAARMLSAAWGGQVLVNDAAAACGTLPDGASLTDAGVHVLRDLMEPQQINILAHPTLPVEFPALRTVNRGQPQNVQIAACI
ncbi:adenylate/guanylate cyclase domain-containing protein [Candidatus Fermentibacteria bacterium]|nr:adenylate/guanylate cyclase domain-containing protein [Candidatus Fermentibacteria bacterium]